jgi:hypothetical protein
VDANTKPVDVRGDNDIQQAIGAAQENWNRLRKITEDRAANLGADVSRRPPRYFTSDGTPLSRKDAVHRPDHYARFAIEPITFIMANNIGFAAGNVIKYVMRWDAKDGLQDLRKARRYLDMMIEDAERKQAGGDTTKML